MVDIAYFKKTALSFPGTTEAPHFEKTSFRINRKIFATLSPEKNIATLKLSVIDQSVFCAYDKTIIYPVSNKWSRQGWTFVELHKIRKDMLKDILASAYNEVNKKK